MESLGIFYIALIIGLVIISILIVVAVLKIPQIARYQKAQLKLAILQAKKNGVGYEDLHSVVMDAEQPQGTDADSVIAEYRLKS